MLISCKYNIQIVFCTLGRSKACLFSALVRTVSGLCRDYFVSSVLTDQWLRQTPYLKKPPLPGVAHSPWANGAGSFPEPRCRTTSETRRRNVVVAGVPVGWTWPLNNRPSSRDSRRQAATWLPGGRSLLQAKHKANTGKNQRAGVAAVWCGSKELKIETPLRDVFLASI